MKQIFFVFVYRLIVLHRNSLAKFNFPKHGNPSSLYAVILHLAHTYLFVLFLFGNACCYFSKLKTLVCVLCESTYMVFEVLIAISDNSYHVPCAKKLTLVSHSRDATGFNGYDVHISHRNETLRKHTGCYRDKTDIWQ